MYTSHSINAQAQSMHRNVNPCKRNESAPNASDQNHVQNTPHQSANLLARRSELQTPRQISIRRPPNVKEVITSRQPRCLIPRTRKTALRLFNIRAVQVEHALRLQVVLISHLRSDDRHLVLLQVFQQSDNEQSSRVRAKCPGRVCVSDYERGVGNVLKHHQFPDELFSEVDRFAVDGKGCSACELHLEPSGGDDDICIDLLASLCLDPALGDLGVGIRHDIGGSCANRLVEIPIRADAQTLFPRFVSRVKVGFKWH
jgi:hypothetical protein